MAQGVHAAFLRLLEADTQTARRRAIVTAALGAVALMAAWVLHPLAPFVAVGAGLAGVGGAWAIARGRHQRQEEALRDDWIGWMDAAHHATVLQQITRPDAGVLRLPAIVALVLVVWLAEFGAWLLAESGEALLLTLPFAIGNGLLLGGLLATWILQAGWSRRLIRALAEMIIEGELEADI